MGPVAELWHDTTNFLHSLKETDEEDNEGDDPGDFPSPNPELDPEPDPDREVIINIGQA